MYKQQNPAFPDDVQRAGCNFLSLLALCEREAGAFFTEAQVVEIYTLGSSATFKDWQGNTRLWIEKNCSVVNPDAIAAKALGMLGSKKRVRQVGRIDAQGRPTFWGWANKKPYNDPEYILLEFPLYAGKFSGHWVLADASHNVLFDSFSKDYTGRPLKGGLLYKVL